MTSRNAIPKPSPAQQRIIDDLRGGHLIVRKGTDEWQYRLGKPISLRTILAMERLCLVNIIPTDYMELPVYRITARLVRPTVTYERHDKDCWRLRCGGEVVGFVLQTSDGHWIVSDKNDEMAVNKIFDSPIDAIKAGQAAFSTGEAP